MESPKTKNKKTKPRRKSSLTDSLKRKFSLKTLKEEMDIAMKAELEADIQSNNEGKVSLLY